MAAAGSPSTTADFTTLKRPNGSEFPVHGSPFAVQQPGIDAIGERNLSTADEPAVAKALAGKLQIYADERPKD
jgi:hypothetical protein